MSTIWSVLVVWAMADVSHSFVPTMHAPGIGKRKKRPRPVGQLLGKAKWEKPLADWIVATGVGLLGPGKQDFEAEQVERNDGWRREPFV
jgi:hypothetical protein